MINLGSDLDGRPIVQKYDRSIKVDVDDIDPNHIDDTPRGPSPVIAANTKGPEDGNGNLFERLAQGDRRSPKGASNSRAGEKTQKSF